MLRQACLDYKCVRLLSELHPTAVLPFRSYLHRLLFARALPLANRSSLLRFLVKNLEHQFSVPATPEQQLHRWTNLVPGRKALRKYPAWRTDAISVSALAQFDSAAPEAQQMLVMDLQLRFRLGSIFMVPVPERNRFFGAMLRFLTEPPSQLYPVYPLPEPQLLDRPPPAPPRQRVCAQHSPQISASQKVCGMAEPGRGLIVQRSHGEKPKTLEMHGIGRTPSLLPLSQPSEREISLSLMK